ncbi:MAG: DUF2167 domain-containing protein [Fibrobacteria bacterium]|nr:DUF2167 domain-containing protein [Fibrobacteria bacterium]
MITRFSLLLSLAAVLALPASPRASSEDTLTEAEIDRALDSIQGTLKWKSGRIDLPGGIAGLDLPEGYRYLDPDGAQTVLEMLWGNPDGEGTLGMIFAPGQSPMSDSSWGVVLNYSDEGHIDDKDAAETDFDELLASMQSSTEETNKERAKAGFETVKLVGWADAPHYDGSEKILYWAKELAFGEADHKTLNYFVRILGREGVLAMNAVSGMDQLPKVREGMATLHRVASFKEGYRYADFNSSTDRVSNLGIAALVGGGVAVAAKSGLLKGLLVGLLAMKKVLVVGVLGLGAGIKAWWDKSRKAKEERDNPFGKDNQA